MPIRIYALAKQLKIEHKVLVDVCTHIGISGKGSALASLSDEEVATIKAHLSAPRGSRATAGSTLAAGGIPDRGGAAAGLAHGSPTALHKKIT